MRANTLDQLTGFTNVNHSENKLSFKLPQLNTDLDPSDELSKIEISLDPSWQHSFWARSLLFFAVVGLKFGYLCSRISQIRKDKALQSKETAFRKKEIEYKQLAAETENAFLRLQMNPHFIFNSMNSISSYIAKKDIETANDYLNRFARLMRMILKFAAKPLISMGDEIELLEQYLQTEAMRFEKKFSYEVQLADGMDPDEYLIPTMILQPFVENAIWHGLSPKEGEGKVKVRFWQEGESLMCSVQDNGVGRETAGKGKQTDHESKAMSITAKRLSMIVAKNGVRAKYAFEDLKDEHGTALGTRVQLQFPLF